MEKKKYQMKPLIVEAGIWNGEPIENCLITYKDGKPDQLVINAQGGNKIANIGDYIITNIKGELIPCKPDLFKATYDEVVTEAMVSKI